MRHVIIIILLAASAMLAGCQSQANNPPVRCSDPGSTCELERSVGSRGDRM